MDRLAFNAAAFINASRIDRQMTMNELSNVSTNGFKRSFESTMRTVKAEGSGFESRMQPQGVNTDYINMKPGTMMVTGRDLDISLNEQAVLGVTAIPWDARLGSELAAPRHAGGDRATTARGT